MSSEVLYRKWRPQALVEVVGQEVVTTTLRNAVRAGRVGHAYLFSGPRGTGKTSTGRILAKAVNCLSPVDGEPCNTCEACTSISGGRSLDVIEIDAASNRGIDDIRQLRERVNYAPGSLWRKVYIIDEVHMLTDAASNALLKTLEEPPQHVMFVLATTEFHKVIPTIASRCQCFNFRRLSVDAIVSKLRLVCEREGIEAGNEALEIIARAGDGSLRDAENVVQRLLASHGRRLGPEEVKAGLGVADESYVLRLAGRMVARDLAAGLRVLHEACDSGVDMRQFGRQTVATLRNLLLVKSECEDIVEVGRERREELRE
ncbi:MAG: DNA polymerase III subunit gamma/tau, partial [Chloroflexi bacterium]|nr:DNA polymerase III subunit gamma/tau [Chloroflexota bacterium]